MQFFQKRVCFLGYILSERGVLVDPEKVRAVKRMKKPFSKKVVRALLGLVDYYRKFIPGFGKTAKPL